MNQELAEPTKDYKWQPKKRRRHQEKKGTLRKEGDTKKRRGHQEKKGTLRKEGDTKKRKEDSDCRYHSQDEAGCSLEGLRL